jgi:hypothetical protein
MMTPATVRSATRLSHEAVLSELALLTKDADRKVIAGAFVASLGDDPGFWRAPLIALAAARAAPKHSLDATFSGGECRECGLPKTVRLEEVDAGGQCLPGDLAGALTILRQIHNSGSPPKPTSQDVQSLTRILALVATLPDDAREGKFNEAIRREKLVRGSVYDRRHVIETLGACGILETPDHPGFTTRWTSFATRQDRPSSRVECDPPIAFWNARHGVNPRNVRYWFGDLGVHTSDIR